MKKKRAKRLILNIAAPAAAAVALVIIWQAAAMLTGSRLILPAPAEALKELILLIKDGAFWSGLGHSLLRCVIGFALALLLAAVMWCLSLRWNFLAAFFRPIIGALRSLPTMSVILLLIIWFGSSLTPVLVALLVIMPAMYSALRSGYGGIDEALHETARLYGAPFWLRLTKIYIPMSAPVFVENAAGCLSLNFKLLLAAEVLAQTRDSIGLMMQQSQIFFETGRLLALTVAAVVMGLILENGVLLVLRAVRY